MSVFKNVVARVRDFFLEPEPKAPEAGMPAPKPVEAIHPSPGPGPGPSAKAAMGTLDSFEWEPPETWRAQKAPAQQPAPPLLPWSGDGGPADRDRAEPRAPFSPRNFSTEELQKSSVLDIVAAVDTRGRAASARLSSASPVGGREMEIAAELPNEWVEGLVKADATSKLEETIRLDTGSPKPSTTEEITTLLVQEIPRPVATGTRTESIGFASKSWRVRKFFSKNSGLPWRAGPELSWKLNLKGRK